MSVIPDMTVLTPCDATETRQAVRAAAAIKGPVYIRVTRNDLPDYVEEGSPFELGKFRVLREGSDAAILTYGAMTEKPMEAAELLQKGGISAKVIDVSTMKPFNYSAAAGLAGSVRAVLTAEEHSCIGGLASKVALAMRKSAVPMDYVAVEDAFGQSAFGVRELMEYYRLTAERIAEKVRNLL